MNSCFARIKFPLNLVQRLQTNEILLSKLRTRNLHLSRIILNSYQPNKDEKPRKNRIVFEKAFEPVSDELRAKNINTLYYLSAFTVLVGGFTYLSVLLYRLYCQTTGKGGQAIVEELGEKIASMKSVENRKITVNFNADLNSSIMWNFKPQQPFIKVVPGETALAFYTATNPTDKPITGIATYNVVPYEAGKYFNKIQCFCFEEQQLNPHEEVDMPVFFYLDPEYAEDPFLEKIHDIVLSYTFFEAKEGMQLPLPGFFKST